MPSRAVVFVLCPDSRAYVRAVESSIQGGESEPCVIPVIGSDASDLRGFPDDIETVRYSDSDAEYDRVSVVPWDDPSFGSRFCVSTNDPTCRAAASLLASHSGRHVKYVDDPGTWEREIRRIYEIDVTGSVTLFVPGWTPDHSACTSQWLRRTLAVMRSMRSEIGNRPWGIMTAPSAGALTHLVAKSLVHRGVAERYASSPGFLLTTDDLAQSAAAMPRYDEGRTDRPLYAFDRSTLDDQTALRLTELPASLLVVKSHGRSYCACDGLLCGARKVDSPPEAIVERCVMDMECADPKFPRVDPRRYDAPVLVLDSSAAANWASPVWRTGVPAIAYYALAGPASALIVGDGLTIAPCEDTFDLFWAVLTSSTLGDATVRLNSVRPYAAGDYPYFLLGDPDITSGQSRWKHWVSEPAVIEEENAPEPSYRCALAGAPGDPPTHPRPSWNAIFDRVRVPVSAEALDGQTLFITTHERDAEDVSFFAQYRHAAETELWFHRRSSETPIQLRLTQRPNVRLPCSVVESARNTRQLVSSWSEIFAKNQPALVAAADNVVALSRHLEGLEGSATFTDVKAIESAAADSLDGWCAAQRACCEELLEHVRGGLWQAALWHSENTQARTVDTPCPCCGLAPTLERVYDSPPAPARIWSECVRCDITTDRPLVAGYPTLTLDVPSEIQYRSGCTVKITITGESSQLWCGAGLVAVAGIHHGVVPEPATFEIRCDGTSTAEQCVRLTVPEPPPIAHLYRLRVLTLLNNHWHWASRFVSVSGEPGRLE